MKKAGILLAIFGAVLFAANIVMLFKLSTRIDIMNNKLGQIEMQLAEIRSSVSNKNNMQQYIEKKEKEVFTPSELAEYLNIGLDKVYDMIDSPDYRIPYIMVDGEYRFGKKAIDDWLKGNKGNIVEN